MTYFLKKSYNNTRTKIPVTLYGGTGIFCAEMRLESPPARSEGIKQHGGMFLGRGKALQNQNTSAGMSLILTMSVFKKSYKEHFAWIVA